MSNQSTIKMITGATLIHPGGTASEGSLLIQGNRIHSITQQTPGSLLLNRDDIEVISGQGCYLTPGLIEVHFNGALGCNFNQTSISQIQELLTQLPRFGITSALLTIITSPLTDMVSAIQTLEEAIHYKHPQHCRPLGIHLEGPFINPAFRGTHPAASIRPINGEDLQSLVSPSTKMVTLAPELDTDHQGISWLRERDVLVSLGHSNATFAEAVQAFHAGANSITHLYNAMRPFHHREPGLIGAALCDPGPYVQCIADGAHVHPEALRLLVLSKPKDKILLTSDASPLAGLEDGQRGSFSQQTVMLKGNQVINQEGGLAGSARMVNDCLKNLIKWQLTDFGTAIQFATENPARFLNEPQLGQLQPGTLADLVLWNKETLDVETTFIGGQIVYEKQKVGAPSL